MKAAALAERRDEGAEPSSMSAGRRRTHRRSTAVGAGVAAGVGRGVVRVLPFALCPRVEGEAPNLDTAVIGLMALALDELSNGGPLAQDVRRVTPHGSPFGDA